MSTSNNYAFVTLVTSDSYLPGALAVAGALKDLHPNSSDQEIRFQLVCLVTPETVDVSTIKQLRSAFDLVVGVEVISQEDETGLKLLGRLDLDTVLTKLHVFRLVQFSKLIFLDADVLPIRPLSHLFTLSHDFSAVPDVGWPDIFNSGFMVLTPGEQKFAELIELFNSKGSWDGGDQGLLNEWRGNDWNRLSFIYNTTPTAAYTQVSPSFYASCRYAPAYERFGSQISNIHFIGPNKPWNSLGHRTPFTSPLSIPSESSQQAYNYDRLVDRWYDVYDRHYRAHEDTQSSLFQETHYESVWNTKGISRETSESQPSTTSSLSLDELKRVAIEGLGASRAAPYDYKASAAGPQHGEYWTMPLEGRIDLIRPKPKSKVQDFAYSEEGSSLQNQNSPEVWIDSSEEDWKKASAAQRGQQQGGMSNSRLGTPGPNEVPPSPYLRTVDLPPATPTPRYIRQQYFASESSADEQYPGEGGGSVHRQSRTSSHDRHQRPGSRGYDHGHHRAHEAQHGHSHQHGHRHNSPSQDHLRDEHAQPQRPFSPPMLVWNPAVDPPPTTQPPASTFPTDTYYPNTWDTPPSHSTHPNSKDYPRFPQSHSAPDSQALFEPLPQPGIPESLLRQGHYRNVTGEEQLGATPSPDRTKVKHIFPWEDKPRHMPGRVFPAADSPRPSLFLSPESQASQTSSSEMPTTPEQRPSRQALGHVPGSVVALSPLPGFPPSFSYPNAWDTVPSIQKYAEKLVKPPPPKTLAPAFEEDEEWKKKRSSKSWEDKVEAGSRDGDVEDEGDDSDDEVVRPGHDSDTESPRRSSSQRGSASGRRSSSGRRREVVKQYRDVGVQTDKIEVQNKDVQTNPLPQVTPRSPSRRERRPTMSGTRHWAPTTRSELLPPVTVSNVGTQADKAAVSSSPSSALRETQKRFEKQQASPPLVRRQTLSSPLATSPPIAQKQANKVPSPPVVVRRQSTGNTPTPHASSPSVAEPQRRLEKTSSPASTIRRLPIGTPPASMTPLANVPSNGRRAEKTSSPKTLSRRASTGTPPLVASPDSIPTTPKPTLRTTQSPLIPSPSPMNGQLSGESSLGSPASSAGPVSPADGQSLNSPRRKPGRVWDPARGVDLFKRGSEEVLARFLRMSSWDEEQQQ